MTITLDLAPEAEARLQKVAASHGQNATEYVASLLEPQITYLLSLPTEPPAWVADLKPRDPAYADKNAFGEIRGKWPGSESDAVIEAALEKLS